MSQRHSVYTGTVRDLNKIKLVRIRVSGSYVNNMVRDCWRQYCGATLEDVKASRVSEPLEVQDVEYFLIREHEFKYK